MTGLPSCAKCGREGLLPGHFRIPYACRMVGRGLCGRCYHVELGADRLLDWPRPSWDAEELVAEAELVRATRDGRTGRRDPVNPLRSDHGARYTHCMGSTSSPAPQITRAIGAVNFPAVAEIIDAEGGLIVWNGTDNDLVFSADAAAGRVRDLLAEMYG